MIIQLKLHGESYIGLSLFAKTLIIESIKEETFALKVNAFFLAKCHYMRTSKSWHNGIKVENLEVMRHDIKFPCLIAPTLYDLPTITSTLQDFFSDLPLTHPHLLAYLQLFIISLKIFLRIVLRNLYSISLFCCQLISQACLHYITSPFQF